MIWKIVLVIYLANYVQSESGAISEQRVVIHQLKSEHSDKSNIEAKNSEHREEYAWSYPSYEFSYKVNDPNTHDIKGQQEKRHGDEVKGLYWLIEPNGYKRTVNYQADDNIGFNADVEYIPEQHSTENESKNSDKNDNGEINSTVTNDTENKKQESNNNKEKESINNQQSANEQADVAESSMENQNNMNSNDNPEKDGNQGETANQNENRDESQNNDNNVENDNDVVNEVNEKNVDNENNDNGQEETKVKNIEYNNRRKKRVNTSGNKNSDNGAKNGRNRSNQSSYRYRDNEHNKKPEIQNQKRVKHASRGSNKESNINLDSKTTQDEKKEQTNNYELRFQASDTNKDRVRNIEDRKSRKFEHRIRIIHPKTVISKP